MSNAHSTTVGERSKVAENTSSTDISDETDIKKRQR